MESLLNQIKDTFKDSIIDISQGKDMPVIICAKDKVYSLLEWLRDTPESDCKLLTDITAVDYLKFPVQQSQRFEVIYLLHSLTHSFRLRVKVPLGMADLSVATVSPLWKTANWLEREVWDMFGIDFIGHPNLKRILNHIEFKGHPLRKDYPIERRQVLTVNDSMVDEMEKRLVEKGLK